MYKTAKKLENILAEKKEITRQHDIGRTGATLVVTRRDLKRVAPMHSRIIRAAVRKAVGRKELVSRINEGGNYISVHFENVKR